MDYALETTFDIKFTSRNTSGVPTTLAGTPAVEIYEDNSTTQITGAVTLTVDFDGVTGLNNLQIAATAANGFESGKSYSAVISAGTVGGTSVVGEVIANFTIERLSALAVVNAIKSGIFIATDVEIGTVNSQTNFTLTSGPSNDISDGLAIFFDASDSREASVVPITSYTSGTGILVVESAPGFAVEDSTPDTVTLLSTPGRTLDSADFADDFLTEEKIANNAITAAKIAANAITAAKIADDSITPAKVSAALPADVTAIGGSTAAATKLAASALGIIAGTAQTGTLSTTVMTSDLTGYADDELVGATIVWTSGTAAGQRSAITGYASADGTVTYDAITTAPANNDTFVIV